MQKATRCRRWVWGTNKFGCFELDFMECHAYTPPLLCKHLTTLNKNPKYFLFDKNAHIDHSCISVRQIFKIKFIEEVFFFFTTLKLANYYNIWLRVTLIALLRHIVTVDTAFFTNAAARAGFVKLESEA